MRRHDWVTLAPGAPLAVASCPSTVREWLAAWSARGGPLVATRQCVPEGDVALGAVAPARLGGARVACTVGVAHVARVRGPVTVVEAAEVLPSAVASTLASLQRDLARCDARVGVYGSTAWSFLAGETYRHAASDVDVVCDLGAASRLDACLDALRTAQAALSCRLDGEIRFACERAVAWRELDAARREGVPWVLAKGAREVGMAAVRDLVADAW